jgi:iron(III) transport system substrate-binding protein
MKNGIAAFMTLLILLTGSVFAQDNVVNVYSSRHYNTDDQIWAGFTEATGIKVNMLEAGADELIERIRSEGANSPADVFITVDAGRLWLAEEAGILASVSSAVLEDSIPASLRHPEGKWFGLTTRARILVYAKGRVDPSQLSTYEDLASDKWQGRLCVRSSTNVYNQSLIASMVEEHGSEAAQQWAAGIARNLATPPQGGDRDQIRAVASGQCDVAISNHYYLAALMASENPADQAVVAAVDFFFPNQADRGTHVNISGAGVVRTAPHPENALRFIEYLASPAAQELLAQGNNEFPVVEGVALSPLAASFGEFKADNVNVSSYGRNAAEAVRIADRASWR